MGSPTDIRKGKVMMFAGAPHLVLDMMHRTQGRQAGFVQVTLRNLRTGSSTTQKIRSTETVEFCFMETQSLEFSYADAEGYHFMDPETFEDKILPGDIVEDAKLLLVESNLYNIMFVEV